MLNGFYQQITIKLLLSDIQINQWITCNIFINFLILNNNKLKLKEDLIILELLSYLSLYRIKKMVIL
jgi:hypothetical protein